MMMTMRATNRRKSTIPTVGGWLGAEFIAPADGDRVNGFFSDYARFREKLTGTPFDISLHFTRKSAGIRYNKICVTEWTVVILVG